MASTAEILGVLFGIRLPLFRQIIQRKDSGNRAYRNARAAIDTLHRVDKKLIGAFKLRLIFFGVYAVDWASVHARRIFRSNARFCDYIGHVAISLRELMGLK